MSRHRLQLKCVGVAWIAITAASACNPSAQPGRPAPSARRESRAAANTPDEESQPENRFDPYVEVQLPGTTFAIALAAATPAETITIAEGARLEDSLDDASLGRLAWLQAHAELDRGNETKAVELFRELAESPHPLSPVAALEVARRTQQSDPDGALTAARRAAGPSWSGQAEATLLTGMLTPDRAANGDAIRILSGLLGSETPRGIRAHAAILLAKLWTSTDAPAGVDEARVLEVLRETRTTGTGTLQQAADEELSRLRPSEPQTEAETPGPAERRLREAQAHFRRNRYQRVRETLRRLLRRPRFGSRIACEGGYLLGKALLRMRDRDEGANLLERVADTCQDTDLRARALYNAAQARVRLGQEAEGIALYQKLEEVAPTSTLADDARYKAALAAREAGEDEQFTRLLESLPEAYPEGDMRRRARFTLAWSARGKALEGEPEERETALRRALTQLEASLGEAESGRSDLVGREAYWRGRLLQGLEEPEAAAGAWRALSEAHPVSYYGWLAAEQLAKQSASERERLDARCRVPAEALPTPSAESLQRPTFQRALELLRVRERETARQELQRWQQEVSPSESNASWFVVALLRAADDHTAANRIVRRKLPELRRSSPFGAAHGRWRLAYPRAFESDVTAAANATEVPPELIWAVMRSESVFDARAESPAGAYGLMQLILPTARRFAQDNEQIGRASLFVPARNVRLGSRFLAYLSTRFPNQRHVIPAAYNAGEGAARRWLRERPEQAIDAWIEEIPYDESRRYSRRVLSSYAVYRCLAGHSILWLPAQESP